MPLTTRDKSYFGDKPLLGHEQLRKSDLIVWIVNKYLRKVLVCKTPGEPSLLFWCLLLASGAWECCSAGLTFSAQPATTSTLLLPTMKADLTPDTTLFPKHGLRLLKSLVKFTGE